MACPQKENGFTPIANELLEKIIASGLNGTELAVIFFIIRKTYGFQKKEDEISLSQFLLVIPCSKQTLCTALKNLQLVKILRLVKKGNSKICSNLWVLNKDYDTWQLVKKYRLVKVSTPTSQDFHIPTSQENLTYKRKITKEITKDTPKISKILVDTFLKEMNLMRPDGDYLKDNILPAKEIAKYIIETITNDINDKEIITKPTITDDEIIRRFLLILQKMDDFHRKNSTNLKYIKYNFNKIINTLKKYD